MARQFRTGETVKFATCGPNYNKVCEKCRNCIADAWDKLDKTKKGGCSCYVHGIIIDTAKKEGHRGTVCTVQIRDTLPTRKKGDVSMSVAVPNWLLRPSTKVLSFKTSTDKPIKKSKVYEIFNPFSVL